MATRHAIQSKEVRPQKGAQIIAVRLRNAIVTGKVARGEMLPVERVLMETFSVSRATMREALRILEAEGLLEVARGANGGARVIGPSLTLASHAVGMVLQAGGTKLHDVQIARQIIEPPAARMAAERPQEDREEIVSILSELLAEEATQLDEPEFSYRAMDFHEAVVKLSGNRTLSAFLYVLHDIHEGVAAAISEDAPKTESSVKHRMKVFGYHQKLINCIKSGDGPLAEKIWREYWEWITPYTNPNAAIVDVLSRLDG